MPLAVRVVAGAGDGLGKQGDAEGTGRAWVVAWVDGGGHAPGMTTESTPTVIAGNPVARLRRTRNMTQARLAQACGVSTRTVKRAERGEALSDETVLAICAVLGCSATDIVAPVPPPAARPCPGDGGVGRVLRAIAWGAVAALALNLVALGVGGSMVDGAGPLAFRVAAWMLMLAAPLAMACGLAGIIVSRSPRAAALFPGRAPPGPLPAALLAAASGTYPALLVGMHMAAGGGGTSAAEVLAAVVTPALWVLVAVLSAGAGRVPVASVLRAGSPHLVALAVVMQAVGLSCGDAGVVAGSAAVLFPVFFLAPGLSDGRRLALSSLAMLPWLQRVYVEGLLPPAPSAHDAVTFAAVLVADLAAVAVLALPRLRGLAFVDGAAPASGA